MFGFCATCQSGEKPFNAEPCCKCAYDPDAGQRVPTRYEPLSLTEIEERTEVWDRTNCLPVRPTFWQRFSRLLKKKS